MIWGDGTVNRKTGLALLLLAFIGLAFVACTNNAIIDADPLPSVTPTETPEMEELPYLEVEEPESYTPQGPFAYEFGLTIRQIWDGNSALLETLDVVHALDYNLVQMARGGEPIEEGFGLSLLVQTEVPLYEFSIIAVAHDVIEGVPSIIFIPLAFLGEIDVLNPNEGFLITNYIGWGTMFWSGISFLDETGVRRYFTMGQNQGGRAKPDIWGPDILDLFEDGTLQVAWVTDGGGVQKYFTVNLDEDGRFCPDAWWNENWGHFSSFLIIPFQDLTSELPYNWGPWWEEMRSE